MEHGEARLTGAQARAKLIRNGIERDRDTDGVERDGNETRKYNRKEGGNFRICKGHELTHNNDTQIGSSVRPREVATHGSISRRFEMIYIYEGIHWRERDAPRRVQNS